MRSEFFAQIKLPGGDTIDAPSGIPTAPSTNQAVGGIASWIVIALTAVGIVAALIFLITGAIKWIMSGGDVEKLTSAKKTVTFSIVGLVIVLLSGVVIVFVTKLLG